MTIFVEPIPEPSQVPELKPLLDHKHDDEFVIVSRNVANPMDACLMAARIVSALSRPYQIGGLELTASDCRPML